jgi:hypothetical protein
MSRSTCGPWTTYTTCGGTGAGGDDAGVAGAGGEAGGSGGTFDGTEVLPADGAATVNVSPQA